LFEKPVKRALEEFDFEGNIVTSAKKDSVKSNAVIPLPDALPLLKFR
jgi:hypothetical protein